MAVTLKFFVDLNRGRVSSSPAYLVQYAIPELIVGDTVRVQVGLVEEDTTGGPGALNRLNVTGYSCKIAIGTEGSTPETSATLAVISDGSDTIFSGTLPMNTTAVSNLFTASPGATISKTFELEFSDGTGTQTIKQVVKLRNELITSSLVDVPAPEEAISKNEAAALYLKKSENAAGEGFILVSPDGLKKAYLYLDNNGNLEIAPIS